MESSEESGLALNVEEAAPEDSGSALLVVDGRRDNSTDCASGVVVEVRWTVEVDPSATGDEEVKLAKVAVTFTEETDERMLDKLAATLESD